LNYTPSVKKQAQKALKHIFFHCRRGRKSPAGAGLIKSTNWELSL
jgi:hypothetical protein